MKLTDREWKPVLIASYFSFIRGRENNMALLETGDIPLISAKNGNNGLKGFVSTSKSVVQGNCITLNNDGDGGAGLAYYQPTDMALDTHVTALIPKVEISMFTLLFISKCLSKLHGFFGHGLSISNERAVKIRIMLPTTSTGEPDFKFMEDYIKELMNKKILQYKAYVAKAFEECMIDFCSKKWEPFPVPDIFEEIQRGKRLKNADHIAGIVPYVSSTALNNGVDDFIVDTEGTRVFSDCISLANSGSVGSAFYEPFRFVASDHITHLSCTNANMYIYLFLISVIKAQKSNFNFNREINDQRIKRMRIMLPVDGDGNPDYAFMEQYGKMLVAKKYKQYFDYLKDRNS